ncbi:MAG: glutamate--tRNA ligase [Pseudomonadota bacterium]
MTTPPPAEGVGRTADGARADGVPVLTRFAPSPTGRLHVGNARSAVLNWALARQAGGRFLLRLDDTDAERSSEAHADAIRRDLDWLGLHWDGEFRQSDRLERYHAAAGRLRAAGRLYDAWETPEELDFRRRAQGMRGQPPVYDRAALALTEAERDRLRAEGRTPHHRFLLDRAEEAWNDLVRGHVSVDAASVSDPVLIRADGQVLYTLASVVDDAETGITHVIRGADHVTNTGAQRQLFRALGATPPVFGHHSLLTAPDGQAFSKRLGDLSIGTLRDAGIEPVALVAFLARLGSSLPVEVATTHDEVLAGFDLARFGRADTRFDRAELDLHAARTLRALPVAAVAPRLAALGLSGAGAGAFWAAVAPNLDRFDEAAAWASLAREGTTPLVAEEDRAFVAEALALLPPRPWDDTTWARWTAAVKAATGRKGGALFRPLRRALTGRDRGPEMAALLPLLQHVPDPADIASPGAA